MGTLYVDGKPVATFPFGTAEGHLEVRDDSGQIYRYVREPAASPIPWEPNTTMADIERRLHGPAITFEEMRERLGWK